MACAVGPSTSSIKEKAGRFVRKFLKDHQEGITEVVQKITKKGECGREKSAPEWVKGQCEKVKDVLDGEFDKEEVAGKWYGVLQSNDIFKQGKAELLNPNRYCVSYDITPTSNGLKMKQISYSDENGSQGQEVNEATLTQTNEGTATFRMEGSQNGFDFAQLTAVDSDDHATWYFTRNNGNGTCSLKMATLSRTKNITVDSLIAFHEVVLIKNTKALNLHPRMFHVSQDSCPTVVWKSVLFLNKFTAMQ